MAEAEILAPKKRRINPIWLLPIIAALLVYRHRGNIQRLRQGTEPEISL